MKNLQKKIVISIIIAAVIYLAFSIYVDFDKLIYAFSIFNWLWFPFLLLLSFLNYYLRFERWHYYSKILQLNLSRKVSFTIFIAGLVMSITPGKMGELLKCYLIKELNGTSVHSTAPIILVERINDFVSLLLVAMVGAIMFGFGSEVVLVSLIVFSLLLVILSWRNLAIKTLTALSHNRFLHKYSEKILHAYENSYKLLKPFPLFSMLLLACIAWGFEAVGLFVVLKVFNTEATLLWSVFVYFFSSILGGLSMIPGGLGSTELSLTILLVRTPMPDYIAIVSTFLIRIATLWFAVVLGIISLIYFQRNVVHKKVFEIDQSNSNNSVQFLDKE